MAHDYNDQNDRIVKGKKNLRIVDIDYAKHEKNYFCIEIWKLEDPLRRKNDETRENNPKMLLHISPKNYGNSCIFNKKFPKLLKIPFKTQRSCLVRF